MGVPDYTARKTGGTGVAVSLIGNTKELTPMMIPIVRNLINTAVIITASAWAASPARAEIPVPTGDTGNEEAGDNGDGASSLAERGAFPAAVLERLHLANIQEVMMGKKAEKKGQSKEARELGSLLVRDHSAADKRLLAFARRQKIDVSVTGQTLEEPDAEGTGTFDERFAKGMVEEHEKSIADVKKAKEASTDEALGTFLDSVLPMLEHHRDLAQEIVNKYSER
jgi:putative membrane protein